MKQRKILRYLLYWFLYGGILKVYLFGNTQTLDFIVDIIIFIFGYSELMRKTDIRKYVGKKTLDMLSLFFLLGIGSSFINMQNPIGLLWGLRMLLRYIVLFLLVYLYSTPNDLICYKKIMYRAAWFNIPIVAFEYFIMRISGDPLGGTFTSGSQYIVCLVPVTLMMAGDYFRGKYKRNYFAIVIIGMFFFYFAAEVKAMYFMLPFFIYMMYSLIKKNSINSLMMLLIASVVFIPVMQWGLSFFYGEDYINFVFDADAMKEEISHGHMDAARGMNRGTVFEITNSTILNSTSEILIGNGIGSGSVSSIFRGDVAANYIQTGYFEFAISYILVETGWIGFIIVCSILLLLLVKFYSYYKAKDEEISYWGAVGIGSVIATVFIGWYQSMPYSDYLPFYFFWAMIFLNIKNRKLSLA